MIEGISVRWLDLYRFNYRESYLWCGVPSTNIVFIVAAQIPIIFLARQLAQLFERTTVPAPAMASSGGTAGSPATAGESPRDRLGRFPFGAGLPIAPAGMYFGAFATTLLLERLEPGPR